MDFELFDLYLNFLPSSFAVPIATAVSALMDEAKCCDESERKNIFSLEIKLYRFFQKLDRSHFSEESVTRILLEQVRVPSDLLPKNSTRAQNLTAARCLESRNSTQSVDGTPPERTVNICRRERRSGGELPLSNAKSIAGQFADPQTNAFWSTLGAFAGLELSKFRTEDRCQALSILLCFDTLEKAFNSPRQIERKCLDALAV